MTNMSLKIVALLAISVHNFIKLLKSGFKTDLNLKGFPKFLNHISGSSSGDNHCCASYFGSQEILTAAHMPLGTPFFRSQSS